MLYGETESVCVWCFDLLARDGKDRRDLPYRHRTKVLQKMLHRFQHPRILYSVPFEDPDVLLEAPVNFAITSSGSGGFSPFMRATSPPPNRNPILAVRDSIRPKYFAVQGRHF